MLGVAAGSGHLGLSRETLLKQIEKYVPARFLDVNIRAFSAGIEIAGQANLKGEK
jgi:indolepyruvate ferredoxin oxidoreductase beta subunit